MTLDSQIVAIVMTFSFLQTMDVTSAFAAATAVRTEPAEPLREAG
ncbi:hypothetical protein PQR14_12510 [Paraburkholderia bryophila]|nr:hypothetical protein [Burkholderia sp. 9120]